MANRTEKKNAIVETIKAWSYGLALVALVIGGLTFAGYEFYQVAVIEGAPIVNEATGTVTYVKLIGVNRTEPITTATPAPTPTPTPVVSDEPLETTLARADRLVTKNDPSNAGSRSIGEPVRK